MITNDVAESIVVAKEGIESTKLHPSHAHLGCRVSEIATDVGANLNA